MRFAVWDMKMQAVEKTRLLWRPSPCRMNRYRSPLRTQATTHIPTAAKRKGITACSSVSRRSSHTR